MEVTRLHSGLFDSCPATTSSNAGLLRVFNTTALLGNNIDLVDIAPDLRNARHERVTFPSSICQHPFQCRCIPQLPCPSTLCRVLLCRAAQLICAHDAAPFFVSRIPGLWSGPFLPWSESDCEMHNVWNNTFSLCFHVQVGRYLKIFLLQRMTWEGWPCRAASPLTIFATRVVFGNLVLPLRADSSNLATFRRLFEALLPIVETPLLRGFLNAVRTWPPCDT